MISRPLLRFPSAYDKILSPAPVAQWTECRPPEPKSAVRVCAGAPFFPYLTFPKGQRIETRTQGLTKHFRGVS
jgi:hypothetical protein